MENNGEHPLTLNKPQLNLWLFCQAITQIRLRGKTKWRDTFNTHFRLATPYPLNNTERLQRIG